LSTRSTKHDVANAVNSFNLSNSLSSRQADLRVVKMDDLEQNSQETEALLKTSEKPKKRALALQIIALCGAAALAGAALASHAGSRDVVVTGLARGEQPRLRGDTPSPRRRLHA
jgi:hypothetical protein